MRVEKSLRYLVFAIRYQLVYILLSFLTRTLLIRTLGVTLAGLNGLFTEVIAVLNVAELGFGTAIVYSLYTPLAKGDEESLRALMGFFAKAYRIVALVVFAGGLLLLPWIHLLVRKVELPLGFIRLVYALFIAQSAGSYLFSHRALLLGADQRQYLVSGVNLACRVFCALLSVAALLLTGNYLWYLAAELSYTLLSNILISLAARRQYPFLRGKAPALPKEQRAQILKNVRHIFVGVLSGKITFSTDSILISLFEGTRQVGYYSSYALLFNAVRNLLLQGVRSAAGSIGNLLATESDEACAAVLSRLYYLVFLLASVAGCCLYALASWFVASLWLGEEFVLGGRIVLLLSVNFFFVILREPLWQMTSMAGVFAKDKNISILGSAVNLFVSVWLGQRLGMAGVFLGTSCTLVIQIALKQRLLCRDRLHRSPAFFWRRWCGYFALFLAELWLVGRLAGLVGVQSPWMALPLRLLLAAAPPCVLGLLLFWKTPEGAYTRALARGLPPRLRAFTAKQRGETL